MTDIAITLTGDEVQYLANAINTHIKTHGLGAATVGVMIVQKFHVASNGAIESPAVIPAPTDRGSGDKSPRRDGKKPGAS